MHTYAQRDSEVAAQLSGRLLNCEEVALEKRGPAGVTKWAPCGVQRAKAKAGLPQPVTRCWWTCFLELDYIRAHESHCKHE